MALRGLVLGRSKTEIDWPFCAKGPGRKTPAWLSFWLDRYASVVRQSFISLRRERKFAEEQFVRCAALLESLSKVCENRYGWTLDGRPESHDSISLTMPVRCRLQAGGRVLLRSRYCLSTRKAFVSFDSPSSDTASNQLLSRIRTVRDVNTFDRPGSKSIHFQRNNLRHFDDRELGCIRAVCNASSAECHSQVSGGCSDGFNALLKRLRRLCRFHTCRLGQAFPTRRTSFEAIDFSIPMTCDICDTPVRRSCLSPALGRLHLASSVR
jgi:hypothetical protein